MCDSLQEEMNAVGKKVSFSYRSRKCYPFNFKMFFKLPLFWRNTFLENRRPGLENVIRYNSRCQENTKDKANEVGNKMPKPPQLIMQAYQMVMVQNQGPEGGPQL